MSWQEKVKNLMLDRGINQKKLSHEIVAFGVYELTKGEQQ